MIDVLVEQNEFLVKRIVNGPPKDESDNLDDSSEISVRPKNTWQHQRERIRQREHRKFQEFQETLRKRNEQVESVSGSD